MNLNGRDASAFNSVIEVQIKTHELRLEDIFPRVTKSHRKGNGLPWRELRYRGPNGKHGKMALDRQPDLIRAIKSKGESLDDYLIKCKNKRRSNEVAFRSTVDIVEQGR